MLHGCGVRKPKLGYSQCIISNSNFCERSPVATRVDCCISFGYIGCQMMSTGL